MPGIRINLHPRLELRNIPLIIGCCCSRQSFSDKLHMHDHTEIWYTLSGTVRHIVNEKEYILTPGSCIIVPPYTPHDFDTTGSDDSPILFCVDFSDKAITDCGVDYFSYYNKAARFNGRALPIFRQLDGRDKSSADAIARTMISEYEDTTTVSFDKLSSLLIDFLNILCRDMPRASSPGKIEETSKAITAAVQYISENYRKNISLDELCSIACMSRSRFTNAFRLVCGMTSGNVITALRLRVACTMLTFDDKTVDEIAKEVGLYDKARLSRALKEHYGLSPSEFRKLRTPNIHKLHFDTIKKRARYKELVDYYRDYGSSPGDI